MHAVGGAPWFGGGIDVEAGTGPKIPGVVLAGEIEPAWRGIWECDGEVVVGGSVLEEGFLGAVSFGTCEAGEVDQEWDSFLLRGSGRGGGRGLCEGREVEVQIHGSAS